MNKRHLKDIIEWDVINWSKAIEFWSNRIELKNKNYSCLELGGRRGGLSLWLALEGNGIVCSDLDLPGVDAIELHRKYNMETHVTYASIDATNIPFKDYFDIVIFKSILGGISRNNNHELKKKTIDQIYKSLDKGGKVLFAENLEGSFLHRWLRKNFIGWGKEWNYLKLQDVPALFSSFTKINYITVGFWGAFGRTEKQRTYLGKLDCFCEKIIPSSMHYIVIGIAEK